MKKTLLAIITVFAAVFMAGAVPATPYPVKYVQPDGSTIIVRIHGDEFYHYTTSNGRVVARGKDGFYRPASKPAVGNIQTLRQNAMAPLKDAHGKQRASVRPVSRKASSISVGDKHFLVLLIEFDDIHFTVPNPTDAFSRMLNQQGYSDNQSTGSVADYYRDNSNGKFRPVFDVYGPVRVSGKLADYGGNIEGVRDKNVRNILPEACRLLDPTVDFSIYDLDGDKRIENIFFFFAGRSEAEGSGDDYIWPHSSWINDNTLSLDGVTPGRYACSSEYWGANGNEMAHIGVFSHEFAHVLGLPDFYDVDYETDGTASSVGAFSLMDSGCYNNDARTPPYFGAMERWLLGWIDTPKNMQTTGPVTLGPVYDDECAATPTSTEGEFFLYEVRDGSGWDSQILARTGQQPPHGLVIYHVDMSTISEWNTGSRINTIAAHPNYYIERPRESFGDYNDLLWPGNYNVTRFEGTDWSGQQTGYVLNDINYSDSKVSFNYSPPTNWTLSGKVCDSNSNPIKGVYVRSGDVSAFTEADGSYELVFDTSGEREVSFSLDLFRPKTETVKLLSANTKLDAILWSVMQPLPIQLAKHNGVYSSTRYGYPRVEEPHTGTQAVSFSPEELAPYKGYQIDFVRFIVHGSQVDSLSAFIDFDNKRVFTTSVNEPVFDTFNNAPVSPSITIPENKTMYIGYAVKGVNEDYWMCIDTGAGVEGGGWSRREYASSGSDDWAAMGCNLMIDCVIHEPVSPFASAGFKLISTPSKDGVYSVGTTLDLSIDNLATGDAPQRVQWLFDDNAVSGTSVVLTSGKHIIRAMLYYSDGSTEELEQAISVK